MYKLPDVIQVGPFPLTTALLMFVLGLYLFYWWTSRRATGAGLDGELVSETLSAVILYALAGAKLGEVITAPTTYLSNPGILLLVPQGWPAWLGGAAGAALSVLWFRRRHPLPPLALLADVAAPPAVAAAGVVLMGRPGPYALIEGALVLAATSLILFAARHVRFRGHLALTAVVVTCGLIVLIDFLTPGPTRFLGFSVNQLAATLVAGGALLLARRLDPHDKATLNAELSAGQDTPKLHPEEGK